MFNLSKANKVAFFNILSIILLRGISIVTAPLFSRLLGVRGYGIAGNYNVWVGIITIVCSLNTHGTLINAKTEFSEEEQDKYNSSIMTLSLSVFALSSLVIFIFIKPISKMLNMSWMLIALVMFQSFGGFCIGFMNTKLTYQMKAGKNMTISVFISVFTLILSILLVLLLPNEINYYGRVFGNAIVIVIVGTIFCIHILKTGKTFYNKKYWSFCLSMVVPLIFYNLSGLLLGHSDLLAVKGMRGDVESGVYSFAYNFSSILSTLFGALNNTWVPFYFENAKLKKDDTIKVQSKNFLEVFTALAIGFLLLYKDVFFMYAPEEFWDGAKLIPIFVACCYINFLCAFPVNFEYFHKKINIVATATIISSLINIGLNLVLIKHFGILGASVATLVSYTIQFLIHCIYIKAKFKTYNFGLQLWWKHLALFAITLIIVIFNFDNQMVNRVISVLIATFSLYKIYKRKTII